MRMTAYIIKMIEKKNTADGSYFSCYGDDSVQSLEPSLVSITILKYTVHCAAKYTLGMMVLISCAEQLFMSKSRVQAIYRRPAMTQADESGIHLK